MRYRLTSYYWFHHVYSKFKEKVTEANVPADEVRRAYYRDTDQIDFNFYKKKLWASEVWLKLIETRALGFETYLSSDKINFLSVQNPSLV